MDMNSAVSLVEKAARALDEAGKLPFYKDDIIEYIKKNFNKSFGKEEIENAIEILLVSSEKSLPVRKCIYEYNDGYSYMYACSFGVH